MTKQELLARLERYERQQIRMYENLIDKFENEIEYMKYTGKKFYHKEIIINESKIKGYKGKIRAIKWDMNHQDIGGK